MTTGDWTGRREKKKKKVRGRKWKMRRRKRKSVGGWRLEELRTRVSVRLWGKSSRVVDDDDDTFREEMVTLIR